MIKHPKFISAILLIQGVLSTAVTGEEARPNILFIAADDLRMNIGCYGDPVAVTPHIDKLAGQSIVFDQAYCQFPSCNASRASVLTGMRPDSISVWHLNDNFREINPEVVTLPQYLKEHGYHTESIGKVLHNYNNVRDNEKSWSVPARLDQVNHFTDYASAENRLKGRAKGPIVEEADVEDEAYADGRITRDAVATIQRLAGKEEPFFLAVGFLKPHSPFNAPSRYWDLYDRKDMKPLGPEVRPKGLPEYNWFYYQEIRTFPEFPDKGAPTEELARVIRHGYYAATSFVDANVGKLMHALEASGEADNTIIVFWSDHGYHLGENSHWSKVMARNLDGHVPLLLRLPGGEATRTKAIVEYIDLFPTLVELCQLPPVEGIDGQSFAGAVDDTAFAGREAALTQVCRPWPAGKIEQMGYSIADGSFRYTQWVEFTSGNILAEELYDHTSDPLERSNRIDSPAYAAERTRLMKLMERTIK